MMVVRYRDRGLRVKDMAENVLPFVIAAVEIFGSEVLDLPLTN